MTKLFKYLKSEKKLLILLPIVVLIEALFEILIPIFMGNLIDMGINPKDASGVSLPSDQQQIFLWGAMMIGSAIIALIFGVIVVKLAARISTNFGHNLRLAQYEKIQEYSFENIDNFKTSSLVTRMTMDVNNIQNALNMILRIALRSPALLIFSIIAVATYSGTLAMTFVITIPILIIGFSLIIKFAHAHFVKMFTKIDKLNLTIQEDLTGIRTVKSYVRENYEINRFGQATNDLRNSAIKAEKIVTLNNPLMSFAIGLSFLLIGWFGSQLIVGGKLSEGQFANTITYINQVLFSLMMISHVFLMFIMSRASAARISEVLDEESTLTNKEMTINKVKDGSFSFKNVSFGYSSDSKKSVLQNINLSIKSGQTVGIFGSTGTGKSTLVQLLARLYDVTTGSVSVGGVDVRDYDLNVLREDVILVLQKNVLFSGTIKENIKWGKKDASDEEVIAALKKAQAYDFVMAKSKGLDSWIEQGGVNVSGGQRQRLTIARALIADPKILILDDSTSAVDTKTDAKIRKSLKNETPEMTKVIISQRLSSIEDADVIIIMDENGIAAIDSHDNLIKNNRVYQVIYEAQSQAKEVDA